MDQILYNMYLLLLFSVSQTMVVVYQDVPLDDLIIRILLCIPVLMIDDNITCIMFYSLEMLKLWHKTASSKKEVCKLFLPFSQGQKRPRET